MVTSLKWLILLFHSLFITFFDFSTMSATTTNNGRHGPSAQSVWVLQTYTQQLNVQGEGCEGDWQ